MAIRSGSGWSRAGSPRGMNPPFLKDGYGAGPRVGPRIFFNDLSPHEGASFLQYLLTGETQDDAGLPLPGCTVDLYDSLTKTLLQTTVSDGLGVFSFLTSTASQDFYMVAYLDTAQDVFGTTENTLRAV